ncbi:hypothetical protein QUA82_22250 [Microcoleus sp. F8-D3]
MKPRLHRQNPPARIEGNAEHAIAVSLPQNNQFPRSDVSITRSIVGTRHCRILISGNGSNQPDWMMKLPDWAIGYKDREHAN